MTVYELGGNRIKIYLEYRQTCFPDPDMESRVYASTSIFFDCFYRECKKLRDYGAAKLDLQPIIKEMLVHGIMHKNGEIMCFLGDSTCQNKLFYDIVIEQ